MPHPIQLLWMMLDANLEALLVLGTFAGAATVPIYIVAHVFKLADLPPGTRGWRQERHRADG